MLVEINLLPKKEPRNTSLFVLISVLVLILIIGIGITVWIGQSYKGKIEAIHKQHTATQELIAAEQQKIANAESINSLEELKKAVHWAEDYPIKTVPLLRNFTALLPERGFIQTFSYEETGNIVITIQFDTSRDASYYLKSMLDSEWIDDATINSLTTNELTEERTESANIGSQEQEILPRYIAEYKVSLNRSVIKEEASDKGGEAS
ncbi:fimbrial protein [Bacillus sp. S/N-304-OC-R1]|uniref:fimbrial protein n=1 Tax=Bacillus sp. S/N-304-OC-R1 TaxID=2758034 RepID=UPI001C8DF544|nr:fimbrial protein [Bacillus sp. S/N-304-OC-R1]MBY0123960.1 fimbrial protein [Bacillus sp. S/N-304-OC-R1]